MENPEKEISGVIHLLTQSPPDVQQHTVQTFFTYNASFTHPLCRTGSWDNSRWLIQIIYRWYKIMSPRIDLTVNSVAFDRANNFLYVHISQVFRIWIFPFYYAPVDLVTLLKLEHDQYDGKYYISSQNDLYQVDHWVRFIPFWPFASLMVRTWQSIAAALCILGTVLFWPVTLIEGRFAPYIRFGGEEIKENAKKTIDVVKTPGRKNPRTH